MICNIQDVMEINLPDKHRDMVTAYNTEWDDINGQGWEIKNFINLTKDRKTLFDVGSNVGFFSFVFCLNNNVNNIKKSFAFEPNMEGLCSCVDVLNLNEWHDRIRLFPIFLGETNGQKEFLVEEGKTFVVKFDRVSENHKIISRGKRGFIEMRTIDDFSWLVEVGGESELEVVLLYDTDAGEKVRIKTGEFKQTETHDLDTLKIDVEGYEARVLEGAEKTIDKYSPLLFLEIHGHLLKLYNSTTFDVYNILNDYKYKIFDIQMREVKSKEQYAWLFNNKAEIRVICRRD